LRACAAEKGACYAYEQANKIFGSHEGAYAAQKLLKIACDIEQGKAPDRTIKVYVYVPAKSAQQAQYPPFIPQMLINQNASITYDDEVVIPGAIDKQGSDAQYKYMSEVLRKKYPNMTGFDVARAKPISPVAQPEGSYLQSCKDCTWDGVTLTCMCPDTKGVLQSSSYKPADYKCYKVKNANGQLQPEC
jgi:hypothetical protein